MQPREATPVGLDALELGGIVGFVVNREPLGVHLVSNDLGNARLGISYVRRSQQILPQKARNTRTARIMKFPGCAVLNQGAVRIQEG